MNDRHIHRRLHEALTREDHTPGELLAELIAGQHRSQPWRAEAACRGMGSEMFYADRWDTVTRREALAVCGSCPVAADCAAWALDNGEKFGVWGGMTQLDRQKVRRRPRRGFNARAA